MSKTLTAEEFYKKNLGNIEFGIECVMKDTYNIKPFVFATAYANYLHKAKVENEIKEFEKSNRGGTHILRELLNENY